MFELTTKYANGQQQQGSTEFKGVYAVGDCAYITEPYTGKSCPPTAQHAIREGAVVAKNIISAIEEEDWMTERHLITKQKA